LYIIFYFSYFLYVSDFLNFVGSFLNFVGGFLKFILSILKPDKAFFYSITLTWQSLKLYLQLMTGDRAGWGKE